MKIELNTIGTIQSPFLSLENMPIQPAGAMDKTGIAVIHDEYTVGLKDLDGFSHIYIIYHLHKITGHKLEVIPFMDTVSRGIFSTRSPARPAPIGISIVELEKIEENRVYFKGVDVLNCTPLFDIKPYIEKFDHRPDSRSGWMKASSKEVAGTRSDHRFI